MALIPMRPKSGKFNLSEEEKDCLSYYVLSGCQRETAFLKFARPDFIGSKSSATVKSVVSQFFASKDVKDYIESYKATITELLNAKSKREADGGSMEDRKARAKERALVFAMELAEHLEDATDPEMVMKLLDKVGILDGDVEVEELPRRYLPVSCNFCEYRKFVEENCERIEEQ